MTEPEIHAEKIWFELLAAQYVALFLIVGALLLPATHPLPAIAEQIADPVMNLVEPLAVTWVDDVAGTYAVLLVFTATLFLCIQVANLVEDWVRGGAS